MPDSFSLGWEQLGAGVAAVGSLGIAAFGLTESLGKALAFRTVGRRLAQVGLPYAGFQTVKQSIRPLRRALEIAYGAGYLDILAQQYRAGRSQGAAPDSIRQGVRLALPFMEVAEAADLIGCVWDMGEGHSRSLAQALQATEGRGPPPSAPAQPAGPVDPMQALAGRFATALDARINAAFALAEERYEAQAKLWAGVVAIILALVFNWGMGTEAEHAAGIGAIVARHRFPWVLAFGIGLVAVPLAPVAKDISTSLQNALTAFKAIPSKLG